MPALDGALYYIFCFNKNVARSAVFSTQTTPNAFFKIDFNGVLSLLDSAPLSQQKELSMV
ncbi:hypothetical protein CLOSTMETH_01856 [[Clostridium] methylpentosum DSM 5476]|uniref:Uncharacterized protein n=1 Tax=[Clostridium] methylpentosum DSM 5476 TaxID=537013 RepID=C0EDC9_9FIRM|nr:hypothetical protein CLOSTMETH_01856 [[Clostridium] methylpentosum DSM 5476]